jgi:hypothetical protein
MQKINNKLSPYSHVKMFKSAFPPFFIIKKYPRSYSGENIAECIVSKSVVFSFLSSSFILPSHSALCNVPYIRVGKNEKNVRSVMILLHKG